MQVVLLERVANLGDLGDQVNVKAGYGRNYLIPYNKAVPATAANIAHFESQRAELEKKAAERLAEANARADQVKALTVKIEAKASDEGKLFGSISTREIAEAATDAGVALTKREVLLPEGVLRQVGEYEITILLHPEVSAVLNLHIVREA